MIAPKRFLVLAPFLLVLASACGSDGDSTSDATTVAAPAAEAPVDTSETASDDADGASEEESETETDEESNEGSNEATDEATDGASDAPLSDGAAATLTLANGETFEFATVLCTLEPQMAGGSEILFTATSYDDPGLDITQFGDEGTVTGLASISVYNGDYETLWEANSMLGSGVELAVEGSTIRGTGSFYEGEEFSGDTVEGEVVANC